MTTNNSNLDKHVQPINLAFNWERNKNKIASSLIGILSGITADNKLNELEILFLQNWIDNQTIKKGDLYDIYEEINKILRDNIITPDQKEDLLCMLNDCIEYSPKNTDIDSQINEFLGFLKGISSDDVITDEEFSKLREYLSKYTHFTKQWPFNYLNKAINDILQDNIVTKSELYELCSIVQQITGTSFTKDGDAIGGATSLFDNPVPSFIDKYVCPTGQFISGTRNQINKHIESFGAIPQNNVTLKTDIVIIGTLSSREWIHTSTGRKIEKALDLLNLGHNIIITNEQVALLSNSK
jgi:hypothetical protein